MTKDKIHKNLSNSKDANSRVDFSLPTKRFAFTLAEVLITLGIIGIVAAMTIPNLMNKYNEKQTVARLKRTNSIIAQALKSIEEEYDTPENWGLTETATSKEAAEKIASIMKSSLKIAQDCGTDDSAGHCFKNTRYKYLNGKPYKNFATDKGFYKVVLLDGTALCWAFQMGRQIDFFIDINGKNPPNTAGKDVFALTYIFNLGLVPDGHPLLDDSPWQSYCKVTSSGWGCAYYILQFGNMNYLKNK